MSPPDPARPLVFVDDLDHPVLTAEDEHHLTRVLRLRPGTELTISDGHAQWRAGTLTEADLEPLGPIERVEPPAPPIAVGFALVKGDRPELIVQKLTELGVDRIVPFRAERSVVRWDEGRAAKAVARLRVVSRAAAMQCRRAQLPEIDDVSDLARLAAEPGACLADRGGAAPSLAHPLVLVGPEGGWAEEEQALALPRVALGAHVLRVETAAIAAATVLTALRAGLVTEPG